MPKRILNQAITLRMKVLTMKDVFGIQQLANSGILSSVFVSLNEDPEDTHILKLFGASSKL